VQATAAPVGVSQVLNLVVTAGDNDGSLDAAWDPDVGAGNSTGPWSDPATKTVP
jgi:hypothetical protein